ncbi:MAG: GAF domain-containing protein [Agriterribacter sp.]
MIIAPLPFNEEERFEDLKSYDILHTPAECDFDELVELASQICKCPISLITLLDKDQQWFKSKTGIESSGTSRDSAFCAHAILEDEVLVVENALEDKRFFDNPLVTGDPNIRFYAGAPIVSPTGHKLGTICIIDNKPKKLLPEEERALKLLSNQVTKLLEIRRKNTLIRQRAAELIELKSRAVVNFLQETEAIKKQISFNLHEDFAQNIASSLIYLKMAGQQKDKAPDLIKTAAEQLSNTLENIRNLSYRVTPMMINWMATEEMFVEFTRNVASSYSFKMNVNVIRSVSSAHPDITLCTIRIMEQWLKLLNYKKNISSVDIDVTIDSQLCLQITDNDLVCSLEQREKEIVQAILLDQIHTYGGSVELSLSADNKNVFTIYMPLELSAGITSRQAV